MNRLNAKEYETVLADIKKTLGVVLDQFKVIPKDVVPYEWAEMKKYAFGETKIPAEYRELIGLAAIKCQYCIYFHTKAAKMNGASEDEIAELPILLDLRWVGVQCFMPLISI